MIRILVLCTHNSARSQMGEGWLRKLCQDANVEAEIWSAGTEKTLVKPPAIEVMGEIGIDLTTHTSKTIPEVPDSDRVDAVVTVCDSANDACPLFPGQTRRYHISLPDPSGHDMDRWRRSRDQIGRVMTVFVQALANGDWPTPEALDQAKEA
jgi:arsenate reductase